MAPVVSIILSNLNTDLLFLKERVDTIVNQTFQQWECIVIDGFSSNGSWEFLTGTALLDARFKCYQLPKEGIYKAWNSGINMAKGKYIYIAPSDDTMQSTLLEKMVAGLEQHTDCALAHCNLTIIDEQGNKSNKKNWDNFVFAKFDNLAYQAHIRKAPYDGIIYACIGVVYTSITQLLIKNEVFKTVGGFLTDQGSTADVEWGMRVGFAFNTLHIPEYLATWRVHSKQATDDSKLGSFAYNEKLAYYISHAAKTVQEKKLLAVPLDIQKLQYNYLFSAFRGRMRKTENLSAKMKLMTNFFLTYPFQYLKELFHKLRGSQRPNNFQLTKKLIKKYRLEHNIVLLPEV